MNRIGGEQSFYIGRYVSIVNNVISVLSADRNTFLADKRVFILGSTGMLGQALIQEARRRGIDVYGGARRNADVSLNITDNISLIREITRFNPDIIINTVAQTNLELCELNPLDAYLVNAAAVANIASYCQSRSIKFVQISTDHYYRDHLSSLHAEDHPVLLLNHYAKTKFAGEAYAATAPGSLIIRTNIVGFRNWPAIPTFVEWAIQALSEKKKITLFTDFYTSSIDTTNCAKCVLDLIDLNSQGIINVGAREPVNKADFILCLAKKLGLPTDQCQFGSVSCLPSSVVRANSLGLDVRRVESLLNRTMPNLNDVIDSLTDLRAIRI